MKTEAQIAMDQSLQPGENTASTPAAPYNPWRDPFSWKALRSIWPQWACLILVVFVGGVGEDIGKAVARYWHGIGQVSGQRIGAWLGWGIAVTLAMFLTVWLTWLLLPRSDPPTEFRPQNLLWSIVLAFLFIASAVVAILSEAALGELGGPLGLIAFWAVVIALLVWRKNQRPQAPDQAS